MTREEALKSFEEENKDFEKIFERYGYQMSPEEVSAVKEAIERNKVAISALSEKLSEDGTLTVHVSDGRKVTRVLVLGDNIFGGLYYPDSAENKGEWIESEQTKGNWYCSKCGGIRNDPETGIWREVHDYKPFFCPNCGADMREPKGLTAKVGIVGKPSLLNQIIPIGAESEGTE